MIILVYFSDSYIFSDSHKGALRLNIVAHGARLPSFRAPDIGERHIFINDRRYNVTQFSGLLNDYNISIQPYDFVRFMSCHSADGGKNSFSCQFSRKYSGVIVKGFKGKVEANYIPESAILGSAMAGGLHNYQAFINEEKIKYACEKYEHHYHSVSFCNGIMIKDTLNRFNVEQ
ncbi:hypothetical protein ACGVWS_12410 [Enterobacteriaceae bacterium LUAb1]